MILKTAYWTTSAFSTPARETAFIDLSIVHGFNECARVIIRLSDPDGSILQKYDSDAVGDVIYVGSGKVLLYDLNGNCVFNGRILSSDRVGVVTTLICEDWMNQLKDTRIHYDFREDLDDAGLRTSGAHGILTSAVEQYRAPAYTSGSFTYLMDNDMAWSSGEWDNAYLVFQNSNFGPKTVSLGPYKHVISNGSATANGWANLWTDDANFDRGEENDIEMNFDLSFWLQVTEGSIFDSLSAARIVVTMEVIEGSDATKGAWFYLYQVTSGLYEPIGKIEPLYPGDKARQTIEIPQELLADMVGSDGKVIVRMYVAALGAPNPDSKLYYLRLEADIESSGVADIYQITSTLRNPADTGAVFNTLKIATTEVDLGVSGLGIYEEFEYSIVKPLYNRINGIVTGGDPLVTLTTSVEATTGITTHHANDKSRFEILQYASDIDAAVFWVPLGTTQVQWKQTTDASATTLKDRDVLRWTQGKYDIGPMYNQAIIYGARIDDEEVVVTSDDATSQADYDFVKSIVIRDSGIIADYEADVVGDAFITRDKTVHLQIGAELAGFSSIRLGDYVQVTSTLLGLTAANYTVNHWEYSGNTTKIRLHPRTTSGYVRYRDFVEEMRQQRQDIQSVKLDKYLAPPKTDTWVNP
jgi:hypothetical protein